MFFVAKELRLLNFLRQPGHVFCLVWIATPEETWYGALCKLAKTDPHSRSIKTCIIGSLLWLLKCWTDTPRLFLHLATRYNVPTILFIANDSTSVKKCCSYKGVHAVQTDYPNKFMPIFQRTWKSAVPGRTTCSYQLIKSNKCIYTYYCFYFFLLACGFSFRLRPTQHLPKARCRGICCVHVGGLGNPYCFRTLAFPHCWKGRRVS